MLWGISISIYPWRPLHPRVVHSVPRLINLHFWNRGKCTIFLNYVTSKVSHITVTISPACYYLSFQVAEMLEDMSETGKEGPIQCIFFSEFHADYGPRIVCQVSEY